MNYITNFSGSKISLGPLDPNLSGLYTSWNNDFVVNFGTSSMRPVTQSETEDGFNRIVKDKRFVFFTIFEKSGQRPIGYTYFFNIEKDTAEYAIAIGERDSHGNGYGTETTELMLDYGFNVLALHNILLTVWEYNPGAIRAYEKAGFKQMGRRREARLINGVRRDLVYMDCLATDFDYSKSVIRPLLE